MEPRSAEFIAAVTQGALRGDGARLVKGVCTDSRALEADCLFIALKGEHFDGHDYLGQAVEKGAGALLVNKGHWEGAANGIPVIVVDDTRAALGRLAAAYRQQLDLPLIAVAGSNGKTTTKELIASVLRQKLSLVWSPSSFNNEIGVPLSLLQLKSSHQTGIFEAGTNHPGELAPLIQMIAPRFSVITSIGREHLEHFKDLEGVAAEEGAAAQFVQGSGKVFIGGDNGFVERIAARTRAEVVTVGFGQGCAWRVTDVRPELKSTAFSVQGPSKTFSGAYRIPLIGPHQCVNATFAIALGAELGLTRPEVQAGLAQSKAAKMRLEIWENQGIRVLDDCYNANADSMLAALKTLTSFPCQGRRVAVLGDMAELGSHSDTAHEEVGKAAAELGVGLLVSVGSKAGLMAKGARNAGLHRVLEFPGVEGASSAVRSFLKAGDVVLIKASRVMKLEKISEALRTPEPFRKN